MKLTELRSKLLAGQVSVARLPTFESRSHIYTHLSLDWVPKRPKEPHWGLWAPTAPADQVMEMIEMAGWSLRLLPSEAAATTVWSVVPFPKGELILGLRLVWLGSKGSLKRQVRLRLDWDGVERKLVLGIPKYPGLTTVAPDQRSAHALLRAAVLFKGWSPNLHLVSAATRTLVETSIETVRNGEVVVIPLETPKQLALKDNNPPTATSAFAQIPLAHAAELSPGRWW